MVEKNYYDKANNKDSQSEFSEAFFEGMLEFLEESKNLAFKKKIHKDAMTNLQKAIDLIALNKYHAEVINKRKHQEDLD